MSSVAILIPIYKPSLDPAETYALGHSLPVVQGYPVFFLTPEGLDTSFYEKRFKAEYKFFPREYFSSVRDYSRLLLNTAFYETFLDYEFVLILQTDVFLFRNDLPQWLVRPFDYVGAPWPNAYELRVNCDRFEGEFGQYVRTHVGNGGLSLRRTRKCRALLREFPDAVRVFSHTGSSEDLYFSVMGALSQDFIIPNEMTASRFAVEVKPEYYYALNGNQLPMGVHAWQRWNPEFWKKHLPPMPADMDQRCDVGTPGPQGPEETARNIALLK